MISLFFVVLLLAGCAGATEEPVAEEVVVEATAVPTDTPIPPTDTPIPVTATAVPTNTPIPPTATPMPSPTPINLVAIAEEFVTVLNQGDDSWVEYVRAETAVSFADDTPFYTENMADFTAYVGQAGSQFVLMDCVQEEMTVTCAATENNDWLTAVQEEASLAKEFVLQNVMDFDTEAVDTFINEPLAYTSVLFTMNDEGVITDLALTLAPESATYLTHFWPQLHDWVLANNAADAEILFTDTSQLVWNEQNGMQLVGMVEAYAEMMAQVYELSVASDEAYEAGDFETAVILYTDILTLTLPTEVQYQTLVNRADVYDILGEYELAIVDYETAVAIRADDPSVLNNLCWDYAITEQPELALPYCEQSIALEPDPSSLDSRGLAYGLMGDYEAAIADFEAVVADLADVLDPELAAIRDQRAGWIEKMQNNQNPFTAAVMAELRGEEPPPPPPPPVTTTDNSGNDNTATSGPTAQDYFNQGEAYFMQGDLAAAVDAYTQAIALAPQNPAYYGARAIAYFLANDIPKMITDLDSAINLGTQDGTLYMLRGTVHGAMGNTQQAISDLETALALGLPGELQAQVEALLAQLR
ncbi:MAG: tetratricopeptide repeat protein [Ardenticatenaceae bacterium]|nr:tetratricopeptide repeat protein [Ardenticatenaceae bacterium]